MLTRLRHLVPRSAWDALLAAFFVAVAVLESLDTGIDDGARSGRPWVDAVLGIAVCAPLAWRRRAPRTTYFVMLVALCVPSLVVRHDLFVFSGVIPLSVATYTVARLRDGRLARFAWPLAALGSVLRLDAPGALLAVSDLAFLLMFLGTAWVAGRTMRRFDVQGADLRHTLELLADEQLAREDAAIEEERNRIAVEMHDVVAHAVSLMVVQVGATRMETGTEPERAKLRLAEATGREALVELRRTLGLLRGRRDADLRPVAGPDALPALLDGFRKAGLDVRAVLDIPEALADSVGLTTYRILQEALTNALKHGGRGVVETWVRSTPDRVEIRVVNPVGATLASLPSGGNGLTGMRERVHLFGGTLTAGADGDRFVVDAVLPLLSLPLGRNGVST